MSSNKSPEEIIEMKKRLKAKQMQKESKEIQLSQQTPSTIINLKSDLNKPKLQGQTIILKQALNQRGDEIRKEDIIQKKEEIRRKSAGNSEEKKVNTQKNSPKDKIPTQRIVQVQETKIIQENKKIIELDNKLKRKLTNDSLEKSENEIISKKIHIEKPKTTIEPEPQKEIITKIEEKMVIEKEIQIKIEPQNKMDILKIQTNELEHTLKKIEETMEKDELEKLNERSQEDKNLPFSERIQQLIDFYSKFERLELISI